VQLAVAQREEAPLLGDRLALPEPVDQPQRLVQARDLVAGAGPVVAHRDLVERLAGADPEERPTREQALERHPGLGEQRRVIARAGRRDAGAERQALGRVAGGAEPDPGVPGLARLPPRLQMVGGGDAVEAGPLGGDGLLEEVVR
jgi:hypothetical protein